MQPGPGIKSDETIDEWVRAHVESAYHPCGTCRMGPSDGDALGRRDSEVDLATPVDGHESVSAKPVANSSFKAAAAVGGHDLARSEELTRQVVEALEAAWDERIVVSEMGEQ